LVRSRPITMSGRWALPCAVHSPKLTPTLPEEVGLPHP
jgi:hypothetical protein